MEIKGVETEYEGYSAIMSIKCTHFDPTQLCYRVVCGCLCLQLQAKSQFSIYIYTDSVESTGVTLFMIMKKHVIFSWLAKFSELPNQISVMMCFSFLI